MDLTAGKSVGFGRKLLLASAISASLVGCFSDSGARDPNDPSTFRAQMVDQNGTRIQTGTISVKNTDGSAVTGDAAKLALATLDSPDGDGVFSVTADGVAGVIDLKMLKTATRIIDDQLDVVFVGSAPGYISSSKILSVNTAGDYVVTLVLTSITPPASVPVAAVTNNIGTASSAGGVTSSPNTDITQATVTRAADTTTGTKAVQGTASISIPASTGLTTSTGQSAAPGDLSLTVAYFDTDGDAGSDGYVPAEGALTLFPGGLDTSIEDSDANTPESGSFSSAGFTAIELRDSAGNLITNFDKPLTVEITIPAGTPFPAGQTNTGVVDLAPIGEVSVGDTIPVWTYNELTGKWSPQLDPNTGVPVIGTVQQKPDSTLFVAFQTDHLTYFNLDYWYGSCNRNIFTPVTYDVVDANNVPNTRAFTLSYYQNGGGWGVTKYPYDFRDFSFADVYRAPSFPVIFELRDFATSSLISQVELAGGQTLTATNGRVSLSNICQLDGATVKLNKPNPGTPLQVPVDFEVVRACSDIAGEFRPVTDVTSGFATGSDNSIVNVSGLAGDGTGTATLNSGSSYIFSATAGGVQNSTSSFGVQSSNNPTVRLVLESVQCATTGTTGTGTGSGGAGTGGNTSI